MACIPPNPRRVGYIVPIHGPLDMGSIYSNTPPQSELPAQQCSRLDNKKANTPRSLNYRRSGVQDWTTRKPTPPRSLNNRCSGVQDWTRRKYKGQIPPQPQLATCYVEAGAKLREGRGG